jgi:asparagine synthase (glutamine-hydrolysing)
VSQRRYWRCAWRAEEDMRRDARPVAAEFGALLCDSVRLRMRSDVPFGAFLSGGLDSGSVVALMAEMSGFPVETFTIGYAENAYDERALARQVAARYQTRHHEEVVAADRLDESLTEVLRHYDEPFGDPSAMPVGVVSKLARRSVKMVLTGDGGDEVLSGYTAYQGERVSDAIRRWPRWVAEGASQVGQSLRPFLRGGARLEAGRWTYLLQTAHGSFVDRLAAKASRGHDRDVLALVRSAIPGIVRLEDYLSEFFGACPFASPFYRLMYFHLLCSLPHDMLTKVDRMSMAHSLETRTPFLDYRLVEMMAGVDQRVKMPALKRKAVLRRAMRTRLPAALWRARKRGFSVPLRDWFGDPSWEDRIGELQPLRQIGVTEACIRSLYGAHRAHISDNGRLLWALWILSRWLGR